MGRRELCSRRECSGRELRRAEDVNRCKKAMEAAGLGKRNQRFARSRQAALSPSLSPSRPALPQPRHSPAIPLAAGWALGPAHSAGRGEQPPCSADTRRGRGSAVASLWDAGASSGRLRRAVLSRPVPSRPAEGREPCSRELCSLCLGSSVGGGGAGGAGEGALRRKGKRRAPAPTQSQRTPPPRCGNSRICLQTCPPPTERKTRAFKVLTLIKARLVKDFTQCRKKFARA